MAFWNKDKGNQVDSVPQRMPQPTEYASAEMKYTKWKNQVNSNSEVKKHGDKLINRVDFENEIGRRIRKIKGWAYARDTILIIILIALLVFAGMYVFYPDKYKDTISNVCEPVYNEAADAADVCDNKNNNVQNVTCNNVCEFPDEIVVRYANSTS